MCPNGGYSLILTDIVNEGRFTRSGNNLSASQEGAGDGPGTFSATLENEGSRLSSPQLAGDHAWERKTLDSAEGQTVRDGCNAMEGRTWW